MRYALNVLSDAWPTTVRRDQLTGAAYGNTMQHVRQDTLKKEEQTHDSKNWLVDHCSAVSRWLCWHNRRPVRAPQRLLRPPAATSVCALRLSRWLISSTNCSIVRQDYAGAIALFDDQMKAALPEEQTERGLGDLCLSKLGSFQSRSDAQLAARKDQYQQVIIPMQFEKMALNMLVVVDVTTGKISGLFFQPNQGGAGSAIQDTGVCGLRTNLKKKKSHSALSRGHCPAR